MIEHIELPTDSIAAGESRQIRVYADEPIDVAIKCFIYKPPPERWDTCPECGSFRVKSGEALLFRASEDKFREGGGQLVISIRDSKGDSAEFRLDVIDWENPSTWGKSGHSRFGPAGRTTGRSKGVPVTEPAEETQAQLEAQR